MTVRADGLPERVTIYEVGPRDGLQNEKAHRPDRGQGRVHPPARWPPACRSSRRPASCTRSGCPQLADAAELMARLGEAGPRPARCWCPTSAASTAPSSSGCRAHRDLRQRDRDLRAARTSTAASTSSSRCSSRPCARARDAGLDVRAYVSMCFGDPWEGAVPVEQVVDVGKRLFDLGASQLSLGDTIGVGTAGHVHGAGRRPSSTPGMAHRPARDALPRHLRPGAGQHLRRAAGAASPPSTPAPAASAAAPTPRARPATSPPRTWSGCCTGLGHRARGRPRRRRRDQRLDGRPARPARARRAVVRALGAGTGTIARMSRVVYLHIGAPKTGTTYLQDRLALNAAPARRATACTIPTGPGRRPDMFHFRAALDLLEPGLGRHAPGHADGRVGRAGQAGPPRRRAPSSSATRSSAGAKPERGRPGDERPRRQRDPRRLLRPRPRPPAPGRVAGEHQAGPQVALRRFLDRGRARPDAGSSRAHGPARRARARGAPSCRPSASTWSPCRTTAAPTATSCGCGSAAPSASTRRGRPLDSERDNRSLGIAETQLLRQLNRRLEPAGLRATPTYDNLIRELLAQETLARRSAVPVRLPCRRTLRLGRGGRRALDRLDQGQRRRRRRRRRGPAPGPARRRRRVARPRPGPRRSVSSAPRSTRWR